MAATEQQHPRSRVTMVFSRMSNAIIAALATVAAALITVLGVSQHKQNTSETQVVHLQSLLDARTREAEQARAAAATKDREMDQLRQALTSARESLAEQRFKENASGNGTASPSITDATTVLKVTSTPNAPPTTREIRGVVLSLRGCRRSGTSVSCELTFTNNEEERQLSIKANGGDNASRVVDTDGNVFYASQATLGPNSGTSPDTQVPYGVPVRGSLRFVELPAQITSFALLQAAVWFSGNNVKFEFRNVKM